MTKKKKTSRQKLKIHPEISTDKPNISQCKTCRHANQETNDFEEGLVACKFNGGMRITQTCSISLPIKNGEYYMYEYYDGSNCTWTFEGDFIL